MLASYFVHVARDLGNTIKIFVRELPANSLSKLGQWITCWSDLRSDHINYESWLQQLYWLILSVIVIKTKFLDRCQVLQKKRYHNKICTKKIVCANLYLQFVSFSNLRSCKGYCKKPQRYTYIYNRIHASNFWDLFLVQLRTKIPNFRELNINSFIININIHIIFKWNARLICFNTIRNSQVMSKINIRKKFIATNTFLFS